MNVHKPQRNTQQRRVILEELRKLESHPTAMELHEITRRRLPKISLGTVYRNLELLAQAGTIRKLELGGSEARFDGDVVRHYHVRCVRCGRVDDFPDAPEFPVAQKFTSATGYDIIGHHLEFVGVCPACKASSGCEN